MMIEYASDPESYKFGSIPTRMATIAGQVRS